MYSLSFFFFFFDDVVVWDAVVFWGERGVSGRVEVEE
jgi:hypothetical protein